MIRTMSFWSYHNGYGYECLAIIGPQCTLVTTETCGLGWDAAFVESVPPGLREDPSARAYWETLSVGDNPDGMYFNLHKCNPEDWDKLRDIHSFLSTIGICLPRMFITDDEGKPEEVLF